ncbi:hypothetical protein EON66_02010 [archaeon]|nr:MAG: hypothetical protein EON66_02010 [archaeon]
MAVCARVYFFSLPCSGTSVDKALLDAAPHLKIIGRAGVSVEGIDVEEATRKYVRALRLHAVRLFRSAACTNCCMPHAGCLQGHSCHERAGCGRPFVSGTDDGIHHRPRAARARGSAIPEGTGEPRCTCAHNSSTEKARTLLCAWHRGRNMQSGHWERERFLGTELAGKVVGFVGLDEVGRMVAKWCQAFDMNVVAYDPLMSSEQVAKLGFTPATKDELLHSSDFISLHIAKPRVRTAWTRAAHPTLPFSAAPTMHHDTSTCACRVWGALSVHKRCPNASAVCASLTLRTGG